MYVSKVKNIFDDNSKYQLVFYKIAPVSDISVS